MRYPIFNLFVDDFSLEDIATIKPGYHIANLNLDQMVLAQQDEDFARIINSAELIIPDGIAAVWTYNWLFRSTGAPKISKLAGIDLAARLINSSRRLALLGASEEVIEKLRLKFAANLVFAHHGFFELNQTDELVEKILQSEPDLLLVALGAPKQERFIDAYREEFSELVVMGVGGAFDAWSGRVQRAPRWMIFCGIEWLFRLFQEPYRLKRFFTNVCRYAFLLISSFFGEKN